MSKAFPIAILMFVLALTACERTPPSSPIVDTATPGGDQRGTKFIKVYENASCGRCERWIEHLRREAFMVEAKDMDNLATVKERVGVPYVMESCHTAEIDGSVIEGNVPAEDIERLLNERPSAKGLVVPTIQIGSPDIEDPSRQSQPYDVILVGPGGSKSAFAHHGG